MQKRTYDANRKKEQRASERDIAIPACANPQRRANALASPYEFLSLYFGHRFYNPITKCQHEMIEAIMHGVTNGGDQSLAAPRGEGKTTIAECVTVYCLLKGVVRFPLIVAATGPDASRILENIKYEFESNDLLCADFPEVCVPIRALEGAVQRQNMQTVNGARTMLKWSHDLVVLPTVEGSLCSGAVLMTRGLDAAIRGIKYHSQRPDFVLIDDPETRESAASDYQTETREHIIDRDIAGLVGQGKKISRVALCTVQNRTCLAAKLTDPTCKPSWHGKRYRMLERFPDRVDLWEKYIELRTTGMAEGDREAKAAVAFYLEHREEMEAGAIVSNPARFISSTYPDGTPIEYSALQHCYNRIADLGMDAFSTEYQNDPPEETGPETSGLTAALVENRLSGLECRELPQDIERLTAFIDVGHHVCHWSAVAWLKGCIGFVVDHGRIDVPGVTRSSNEQARERGVLAALFAWRELLLDFRVGNEAKPLDLGLIDSGDGVTQQAVYEFCRQMGHPFYPSKGMPATWRVGHRSATRRVGANWAVQYFPQDKVKLYEFHSDEWTRFVHERFLTPMFDSENRRNNGSLSMFVLPKEMEQARKDRREFVHQIVSKLWTVTPAEGDKKEKKGWVWRPGYGGKDHWLDSLAGNCMAASTLGIEVIHKTTATPKDRKSLAELAKQAKATA